jgi:flagellar assembly protein FliH
MTLIETHMRVARYQFTSFDTEEPAQLLTSALAGHAPQGEDVMAVPEIDLPPPPPTFSEQEMEQAKQAAYQEGRSAGQLEAEAKINKAAEESAAAMQALLDVIANRITLASEEHTQFLKNQQDIILKVTLAIARKIAGEALKNDPYASVESLLKECMGLIAGSERIVLTVTPQKSDDLRRCIGVLKTLLHDFGGEIIIEQDASFADNDCRVEWKNGQASHSEEAVWTEIESLLKKTTLTT